MERYFEKISFEQFKKDIKNDVDLYNKYVLPKRATSCSAGYDFFSIQGLELEPGEIVKIPTGYKAKMNNNEFLLICVRSSTGFKYNVRMCNQIGIIDADYYNNPDNEGHIWVALQNHGDTKYVCEAGSAYVEGIFLPYLTCGDSIENKRMGAFGSTDVKEDGLNG